MAAFGAKKKVNEREKSFELGCLTTKEGSHKSGLDHPLLLHSYFLRNKYYILHFTPYIPRSTLVQFVAVGGGGVAVS